MKKLHVWGAIIGAILLASNLYTMSQVVVQPTSIPLVNVATFAVSALWAVLAAYLVWIYFSVKKAEDAGQVQEVSYINGSSDERVLARRREWVLGLVLAMEIVGSLPFWILNDYNAGLTIVNIETIFDVLFNIVIAYIVIELFRGKRDVLTLLFYTAIAYGIELVVVTALKHDWYAAFLNVLFVVYITYAIKAPLNKTTFRTAHLIMLPLFLIITTLAPAFDAEQKNITRLTEAESLLEQQYTAESQQVSTNYMQLLEKTELDPVLIRQIETGLDKRSEYIAAMHANAAEVREELKKDIIGIEERKALERIMFMERGLDIQSAQAEKVRALLDYQKKLGAGKFSESERQTIADMAEEVEKYNDQGIELSHERELARVDG